MLVLVLVLVLVVLAAATRLVAVAATTNITGGLAQILANRGPAAGRGRCMHGGACSTRFHLRLVMVSMSVSSTES